jgi:NTE family protein
MDSPRRRTIRRRAANSRRAAQIARVLARHGMGSLAQAAGALRRTRQDDVNERPITAARYAGVASELGVTFVRLAHALSMRADLFAPDERAALAAAASQPDEIVPDAARDALAEQLGAEARHQLVVSDLAPLRSGTTTMSYAAALLDGREVVVTIRRPGVAAAIERDLGILRPAARLLARRSTWSARVDVVGEMDRFAQLIEREIDLGVAAGALDALAAIADDAPEVVHELTTSGVLTVVRGASPGIDSLLRLWRQEGIVVLDPASLNSGAFRSVVVSALGVDRFAALVGATSRRATDEVVDLVVAAASRRSGAATAGLRAAIGGVLAEPASLAHRLDAVVRVAGAMGLTFDDDVCSMIAALSELEASTADVDEQQIVRALSGARAPDDSTPRTTTVARSRPPVRRRSERSGPTVGLVLSGGAVRGAAHAAAIEVLVGGGVRPDLIAGTSAGAFVGAILAAGTAPEELLRIISTMRWSTVARPYPSRLGLFDTNPMEAFIDATIGPLTFEDLLCPLAVVSCDLLTGELVVLDSGPVAPAVRASSAIPGVFPPVDHQGRLLIDGGVVDNLPVDVARRMGADYVIAVDVSPPITDGRRPRGLLDVLLMASDIMSVAQRRIRTPADVTIQADVAQYGGWSIAEIPDIQERGRAAAQAALDRIRSDLKLDR